MPDSGDSWMTVEDVAAYRKLSRAKIYDLAQSGQVPCTKVVGMWRFKRSQVDEWMMKQRVQRTREKGD